MTAMMIITTRPTTATGDVAKPKTRPPPQPGASRPHRGGRATASEVGDGPEEHHPPGVAGKARDRPGDDQEQAYQHIRGGHRRRLLVEHDLNHRVENPEPQGGDPKRSPGE